MNYLKNMNIYDRALLILFVSLFSGNMSGILLLPRTFSVLLLPLLFRNHQVVWNVYTEKPQILINIWALWAGVSILWTSDKSHGSLEYVLLLLNFLLVYEILFFSCRSRKPLFSIALGWGMSLFINNCIGIWEIYTDNHLSVSKFGSDHEIFIEGFYVSMRYANGFFSNYNALVTFICCSLPFLFYLFISTKNKAFKLFICINLIASIYILFMDASRGGILSLVIISIVSLYKSIGLKKLKIQAVVLFAVIILYIAWSWETISSIIIGRQNTMGNIEEEARYVVWTNCLKVFFDTAGIGTGIGGVGTSMSAYAGNIGIYAPHNAFLEILVQYGVVVFFLFCYFLIITFSNTRKNKQLSSKIVIYSSLLAMPFIFVINSIYLSNPFFWAFLTSLYVFSSLKFRIA